MNQEQPSSLNSSLLCFLAGAVVGAVVIAFATPKKGSDLRADLSGLGRRARRKVGDLAQQVKGACDASEDREEDCSGEHDVAIDLGS